MYKVNCVCHNLNRKVYSAYYVFGSFLPKTPDHSIFVVVVVVDGF